MESHGARRAPGPCNAHLQRRLCQSLQRRPLLWDRGKGTSQGQAELCSPTGDLPQAVDKLSKRGSLWAQDSVRSSHLHPAVVVVDHCSHLCLLEHDLGHPHCREQGRAQSRDSNTTRAPCCGHISTGYKHCTASSSWNTLPPLTFPTCCSTGAPPGPRWVLQSPSTLQGESVALVATSSSLFRVWHPKPHFTMPVPAPHLHIPVCRHLAPSLPGGGGR